MKLLYRVDDYLLEDGTPRSGSCIRKCHSTQDAAFGGWDGAGNAFHMQTQGDGRVSVNLPKWGVVIFRRA